MYIRSQDKKLLVNSNNVILGLDHVDCLEIYTIYHGKEYLLGKFSSKEKTMKVLDEIQKRLNEQFNETTLNTTDFIFQIPQDYDVYG